MPLTEANSINQGVSWDDPSYEVPDGFEFMYMKQSFNLISFGGYGDYGGELVFGPLNGSTVYQQIMP